MQAKAFRVYLQMNQNLSFCSTLISPLPNLLEVTLPKLTVLNSHFGSVAWGPAWKATAHCRAFRTAGMCTQIGKSKRQRHKQALARHRKEMISPSHSFFSMINTPPMRYARLLIVLRGQSSTTEESCQVTVLYCLSPAQVAAYITHGKEGDQNQQLVKEDDGSFAVCTMPQLCKHPHRAARP